MTPAAAHAVDTQALIVGTFTALTLVWTAVFIATRVRARRLRRPTPLPSVPVTPTRWDGPTAELVFDIVTPEPAFDMDTTAVLRPYRGGRHAAR